MPRIRSEVLHYPTVRSESEEKLNYCFQRGGQIESEMAAYRKREEEEKNERERLTNFNSVFTINCRDYPGGIMDKILVLCIRN